MPSVIVDLIWFGRSSGARIEHTDGQLEIAIF